MKILLLCKKSPYKTLLEKPRKISRRLDKKSSDFQRFKKGHNRHEAAIDGVVRELKKQNLSFTSTSRRSRIQYSRYDLIVTIGGDGTFLDAARNVTDQLILGVNSDPKWSVGQFCSASGKTFSLVLKKILSGRFKTTKINRIRLVVKGTTVKTNILNDILFCHRNPAAMSRYYLTVNGRREEQRSSGLWASTAAGSTSAIQSAGGRMLPLTSKRLQYKPRELYTASGERRYKLKGGFFNGKKGLKIRSLIPNGLIYVDGSHISYPLLFGDEAVLTQSSQPLKVVEL